MRLEAARCCTGSARRRNARLRLITLACKGDQTQALARALSCEAAAPPSPNRAQPCGRRSRCGRPLTEAPRRGGRPKRCRRIAAAAASLARSLAASSSPHSAATAANGS